MASKALWIWPLPLTLSTPQPLGASLGPFSKEALLTSDPSRLGLSPSSSSSPSSLLRSIPQVCTQSLSRVGLSVTPWAVALQAPLSMGFPRQEYWSGLPFLSPGDLPNPGIEPASPVSPALAGRLYHLGSPNPSHVTSVWSPQRGLCDKPKNQVFLQANLHGPNSLAQCFTALTEICNHQFLCSLFYCPSRGARWQSRVIHLTPALCTL